MRLLTALAVIALCCWSAFEGTAIVRKAIAGGRQNMADVGRDVPSLRLGIKRSVATSGAAVDAAHSGSLQQRSAALAAILARHPMSSADWLALAGLRLVAGRPYKGVLAALSMSFVTGPNEGAVMRQRALFGLWQWNALPADLRQRTIADLAGVLAAGLMDGLTKSVRTILEARSPNDRAQIARMLAAKGISAPQRAGIGL